MQAFVAWWVLWSAFQVALLFSLGFNLASAALDSVSFNILTAAACLLVSHIMQFYLPQVERLWYVLAISIILSLIIVFTGRWIVAYINAGDITYVDSLKTSLPVRLGIAFLLVTCMSVISILWYSFQDQKEMEKRKSDAETLTKEAELLALRRQLQPHFLFNSLNSISALVATRPEEARHMVQQLSDFLRGTIKKDDDQQVTLAEELQQLQLYLDIEKVRFGHRLVTNITTAGETNKLQLPALILQPIVENAIKFGLYDTTGTVIINIDATTVLNYLVIKVQNPFDPVTAQPKKGEGFGLSSVRRRLYLLFARNDLLITETDHTLFTTIIIIPQSI